MSTPLPLMVLSGCTLFPKALLPLYIFEPRYRRMLKRALAGPRVFGIGTPLPESDFNPDPGDPGPASIFPVTVTGLIRACVENPDGTSNLVLQGVDRVRITGWVEEDNGDDGDEDAAGGDGGARYLTAVTEPFASVDGDSAEAREAAGRLAALAHELWEGSPGDASTKLRDYLGNVDDPATLVDVVASHLVGDLETRLAILGESSVVERIEITLSALGRLG